MLADLEFAFLDVLKVGLVWDELSCALGGCRYDGSSSGSCLKSSPSRSLRTFAELIRAKLLLSEHRDSCTSYSQYIPR